jgi:hypothetical protein
MFLNPRPRALTSGPKDMLVLGIFNDYDVVAARDSEELPNLMYFMLSGTHILARQNQSDNHLLGCYVRLPTRLSHPSRGCSQP